MKKILAIILSLSLITVGFSSCSFGQNTSSNKKLSVISTIFPSYDFARELCKNVDNVEITMLLPAGTESHSYEPTAADMAKIQNCDLFIYVGGESDAWVSDLLKSLKNSVTTIKMLSSVKAVEEKELDGMQHEEEEEGSQTDYDEHVWTSPVNAELIVKDIADKLIKIDSKNKSLYESNLNSYLQDLKELDTEFKDIASTAKTKIIVVADRFPFRYFADEYGFKCFAAFSGCSTETDPSAATVAFLEKKVKDNNIKTVFYIELSNKKVADTISEQTGCSEALLHSCHNVTSEDFNNGVSYVTLMKNNAKALRKALN